MTVISKHLKKEEVIIGSSRPDFGQNRPVGRMTLEEACKQGYVIEQGEHPWEYLVSNEKIETLSVTKHGMPARFTVNSAGSDRWLSEVPTVWGRVRIDL